MGRSVSSPSGAIVAFTVLEVENDDDWDFGPNIRKRAEEVLAQGGLPDYPEEMKETFKKLLEEHNIDTTKYLG